MSLEDTIDQYWQAYRRHDLDAVLAHLSEDVVIQFPTSPQPIQGKENIRPIWSMLFSTIIPDIHQDVLTTVVQGHTVACEHIETGTLTIPPGLSESSPVSLSPGGRPYMMNMASLFHFNTEGSSIERIRSYWDTGSFAEQIKIDINVIRSLQARAHTLG